MVLARLQHRRRHRRPSRARIHPPLHPTPRPSRHQRPTPHHPPAPPLAITTTSLPAATVGQPYAATLTATGGRAPYTWTAAGLPSGLSLSGDRITGTLVPDDTNNHSDVFVWDRHG
ncbi:putative Ig domain-containing protein [Iamia sp.]|uniref:putative Ig domain-containing protein n=1 Tax=Iamia sp. TaxID=2722710 RepID=UPI0032C23292